MWWIPNLFLVDVHSVAWFRHVLILSPLLVIVLCQVVLEPCLDWFGGPNNETDYDHPVDDE